MGSNLYDRPTRRAGISRRLAIRITVFSEQANRDAISRVVTFWLIRGPPSISPSIVYIE